MIDINNKIAEKIILILESIDIDNNTGEEVMQKSNSILNLTKTLQILNDTPRKKSSYRG